jgi:hypothetical protein
MAWKQSAAPAWGDATSRTCTTVGLLLRASADPQWLFADATPVGSSQGRRAWLIPQPEEHGSQVIAQGQGRFPVVSYLRRGTRCAQHRQAHPGSDRAWRGAARFRLGRTGSMDEATEGADLHSARRNGPERLCSFRSSNRDEHPVACLLLTLPTGAPPL